MKNFSEIGVVNHKCMAVEDEACGAVDGFSKPNADIMKEIKAEEEARVRDEQKNAAKNQLQLDSYRQEKEAIVCYQTILENFGDTALAPKALKELNQLGVKVNAPKPNTITQ